MAIPAVSAYLGGPGIAPGRPPSPPAQREKSAPATPAKPAEGPSRIELDRRLADLEAEKARREKKTSLNADNRSLEIARILAQLRSRDAQVRGHEAAHVAAGGGYIRGGASFSFQTGPDGRQYAVGGEVGIDLSPVPGKPAETAAKMRSVRAAALAPSDPSPADLSIAAAASLMEAQALAELASMSAHAAASYGEEMAGGRQDRRGLDLVA